MFFVYLLICFLTYYYICYIYYITDNFHETIKSKKVNLLFFFTKGMSNYMRIELDFSSEKPIYEQLYEAIIKAMAIRELTPNESLPSVRALAEEIGINLHTVNKAYNLLKDEGYITIDRRKGAIVNKLPIASSSVHQAALNDALSVLTAKAHLMGMDEAEFSKLCHEYFSTYKEDVL